MQTMTTRHRIAPEARREEIRRTAQKLFIERGFEQVALADIAAELGVSRGLMYNYFPSTAAILEDLFRLALERVEQPLQRILAAHPGGPVSRIIRDTLEVLLGEDQLLAVLYSGGSRRFHRWRARLLRERLLPMLQPYLPPLLPIDAGPVLIALMEGVLLFTHAESHDEPTAAFQFLALIMERGLEPFWS